jgi:hypothetical protein
MNGVLAWLRVPITLIFTFLLTRLLYSLIVKKEKEKILATREGMEKKIEQCEIWSSPIFNNAGFIIGFFMLFLAILLAFVGTAEGSDYLWVDIVGSMILGIFIMWTTPVINLTKESILFQPLILNLLHLNFNKNVVKYNDIQKVKKNMVMDPFFILKIRPKDSRELKLNTAFFNTELGNALYEILNCRGL